jgi:hypothetical protein
MLDLIVEARPRPAFFRSLFSRAVTEAESTRFCRRGLFSQFSHTLYWLGIYFAALRKIANAVRRAKRERFDGHGGLAAPRRHQAAAVA